MNFKRYIGVSLIFIILVGIITYLLNGDSFTFRWNDNHLSLPIALWIPIFMFVFLLFSLAYLFFAGFKDYFYKYQEQKDIKNIILQIKSLILGEKKEYQISSQKLKDISSALSVISAIELEKEPKKTEIEEIDNTIDTIDKLKNGEVVELKSFKIGEANPLFLQNNINRAKKDTKYALEILKKGISGKLLYITLETLINNNELKELKKQLKNLNIDKDVAYLLLHAFNNDKINFSVDELIVIFQKSGFNKDDYIKAYEIIKPKLLPDTILSLYEKLCSMNLEAEDGLIYTLLDFEMIDRAKEVVNNSQIERPRLEAFFALKECGKNYSFKLFM